MRLDYDPKTSKIVITCPVWANDLVHKVPSVRWSKARRAWLAPLLRQTASAVRELSALAGVVCTDALKSAMEQHDKARNTESRSIGFPSWYKFKTTPRPHQLRVLHRKYGKKVFALHHDRGTGKTKTEIDYACALRMEGKIHAVLVTVKLSGRENWREQFAEHAPIPHDVYLPTADNVKGFESWLRRPHDFKIMVCGIESMSQGGMRKLAERFINSMGRVLSIIDESHMIANHKAERTKVCTELGLLAEYRDTMTGTPIMTGPLNLFSQFEYLDPGIIGIGDFYAFRNRYAIMGGYHKEVRPGVKQPVEVVGYQNMDELTKLVAPYVDEVRKADVLPDLPPKQYQKLHVQLTTEQRKLYDRVRKEKSYTVDGKPEHVVKNVLELALRLHQIAGGFVTTVQEIPYTSAKGEPKIRRVPEAHPIMPWRKNPKMIELLDWVDDDKQCIIWCAYLPEIHMVIEALRVAQPNARICEIHGGIDEGTRRDYRQAYQKGDYKFMVGNTATGGTADTWTACELMAYYNNTQHMVDREQSEDRAHRDGLKHPVLYGDIIADGTVDVAIIESIRLKIDLSEYIRRNIKNASDLLAGEIP